MIRRIALVPALAAAFLLAGCSATSDPASHGAAAIPTTAPTTATVIAGDAAMPAPVREAELIDGSTISLDELWKKRAVLLQFTASWCERCADAEPGLQKLQQTNGDALLVVHVNTEEPMDDITAYLGEHGVTGPVIVDKQRTIGRAYAVSEAPVTVLIDSAGGIVKMWPGGATSEAVQTELRTILQQK